MTEGSLVRDPRDKEKDTDVENGRDRVGVPSRTCDRDNARETEAERVVDRRVLVDEAEGGGCVADKVNELVLSRKEVDIVGVASLIVTVGDDDTVHEPSSIDRDLVADRGEMVLDADLLDDSNEVSDGLLVGRVLVDDSSAVNEVADRLATEHEIDIVVDFVRNEVTDGVPIDQEVDLDLENVVSDVAVVEIDFLSGDGDKDGVSAVWVCDAVTVIDCMLLRDCDDVLLAVGPSDPETDLDRMALSEKLEPVEDETILTTAFAVEGTSHKSWPS